MDAKRSDLPEQAAEDFLVALREEAETFNGLLSTENSDWIVKGFIDVYRQVYTISNDTKVMSKLIELTLFPYFRTFAEKNNLELVPTREQNHYPDLTFIDAADHKFAVDLKTTYRDGNNPTRVSTMTLGAFTGYFRKRDSAKNVSFPYGAYSGHFVLGVIYSRALLRADELKTFTVAEVERIPSV